MSLKSNFDIQKYYDNGTFDRNEVLKIKEELENENIPYNTEEIIVSIIYLCDGDLINTKNVLKMCYMCKKMVPELFTNRTYEDELIRKQWKTIRLAASPELFNNESPVIYFSLADAPVSEFNCIATIKSFIMVIDTFYYETLFRGCILLLDLQSMKIAHLFRLNIKLLRKLMKYAVGGIDRLAKIIHLINGGYVIEKLMSIIKMVADPKLFEKFLFHRHNMDWEEFYQDYIPRNFLPSDYGGTLESFDELQQKMWQRLIRFNDNYKTEEILYSK